MDQLLPVDRDSTWLDLHPARVRTLGAAPNTSVVEEHSSQLIGLSRPLHLLVASQHDRRESKEVTCTTWSRRVPVGAFCRIGTSLYVSTPEFIFLQYANLLPFAGLVQLGFDMCAGYASPFGSLPGSPRCLPLTTSSAIQGFLENAADGRGVARALQAARYIANRSGSVTETVVVLLLCLPRKHGGYGLKLPQMNERIDIPEHLRKRGDRTWVCPDAWWPESNLALEYDGRIWHQGDEQITKDYAKLNALRAMEISTELVTRHDLFDFARFDLLARRVAKSIGHRMRPRDYDVAWKNRNQELRRELLAQFEMTETQEQPVHPDYEHLDYDLASTCVTDFEGW